jgi:hypothetical protein
MAIDISWLFSVAFQITLFILFALKFVDLIRTYVIPALQDMRDEVEENWRTLREQRSVADAGKKQKATQFLQQEKQIALLTAKLASWHLIRERKQAERKTAHEERSKAIAARYEEQGQKRAARLMVQAVGEEVITEVEHEALKSARKQDESSMQDCIASLERAKRGAL